MIEIDIPGFRKLTLEHLVLDYNGTIAFDGDLVPGVAERLTLLSETIALHVLTPIPGANAGRKWPGCRLKYPSWSTVRKMRPNFVLWKPWVWKPLRQWATA